MKPKFGVIASIMTDSPSDFTRAIPLALEAHTVEIRLDPMRPRLGEFLPVLEEALQGALKERPVILTLRSKDQGGSERIATDEQLRFWNELPSGILDIITDGSSEVYVDWDVHLTRLAFAKCQPFPWSKVGCSIHDFGGTPLQLSSYISLLRSVPAQAFLKLVTMVNKNADIQRIRDLFATYDDPRPLIAFGMGAQGEWTRRRCLSWGSAGTYGYLEGFSRSAPGQVAVRELLVDPHIQKALAD